MKKMPHGVVTTRADGAQWQKQEEPGKGPWKQVKDGDKTPKSRAKQNQMEAGEGTASEDMSGAKLGYQLLRSKYDLDGHLPPDELHPSHVNVDTDGDMDSKPVLSWEHAGKKRNSYTVNYHQRRHRQTFAELKKAMPALREAPSKLMALYKECGPEDKDRYMAAHAVVTTGHTPEQVLGIQRGHVGMGRMMKSGKAKVKVAMSHASGHMFQWEPQTPEFVEHYMKGAERSPTAPMFTCSGDCVRTAMEQVGLASVPVSIMRSHVATRIAADALSKAPKVKIDSYGAGMNKAASNIMMASNKVGAHFGHGPAAPGMSYVPPHVQAAYLESVGGAEHYRNTYDKLNMRKSVRTAEEETIWQSAQEQVLKSIPSTMSAAKIPSLVATLFEQMLTQNLPTTSPEKSPLTSPEKSPLTSQTTPEMTSRGMSPTSTLSSPSSTPSSERPETSQPMTKATAPAKMPRWVMQAHQPHLSPSHTASLTQSTGSTSLTPRSASPELHLLSTTTISPSELTDSPTAASTSTSHPQDTSGPSQASPSSCQTETSILKSGTPTPCSPSSQSATTIERPREVSDLMAKLVLMKAQGTHITADALAYFLGLYEHTNTEPGVLRFMTGVAEYISMVTESLQKGGSEAGTRGDPVGHISIHSDGSRWRKLGPGKWQHMGQGIATQSGGKKKQKQSESVRIQALRARLRKLRAAWQGATSTKQRGDIIKQLTDIKRTIRTLTSDKRVKKSHAADADLMDATYIKVGAMLSKYKAAYSEELIAKGEGFVPPEGVRSAARRGLELRRKHKRGGLDTKQAKKAGVGSGVQRASDLASGDALSIETVKRMKNFFSRHSKYKEHHRDKTSAAYISWLLWGGNAGQRWAESVVRQYEAKQKSGVKKSEAADIIEKGCRAPAVSTVLIDDYTRETCSIDYRNTLGPQDYIMRILKDGGRAAVELQTFLLVKGAPEAIKHIESVMQEVRDGRS
jgi:hypothetical protein